MYKVDFRMLVALILGVGVIPTLAGRWVAKRLPWKYYSWFELGVIGVLVGVYVILLIVTPSFLQFTVPFFFGLGVFLATLAHQEEGRKIQKIFEGERR